MLKVLQLCMLYYWKGYSYTNTQMIRCGLLQYSYFTKLKKKYSHCPFNCDAAEEWNSLLFYLCHLPAIESFISTLNQIFSMSTNHTPIYFLWSLLNVLIILSGQNTFVDCFYSLSKSLLQLLPLCRQHLLYFILIIVHFSVSFMYYTLI